MEKGRLRKREALSSARLGLNLGESGRNEPVAKKCETDFCSAASVTAPATSVKGSAFTCFTTQWSFSACKTAWKAEEKEENEE